MPGEDTTHETTDEQRAAGGDDLRRKFVDDGDGGAVELNAGIVLGEPVCADGELYRCRVADQLNREARRIQAGVDGFPGGTSQSPVDEQISPGSG